MSVKINTITSTTVTTFTTTPSGVTPLSTDNSTFAATTSWVNTFINNSNLILLSITNTITNTLTFTATIITNLVAGASSGVPLSLTGSTISIGKSGGTVTLLGTNPFVTNFPYMVSSGQIVLYTGKEIQAGNYTTASATINYPSPFLTTNNTVTIACPSSSTTGGSFSSYYNTVALRAGASTNMNWITFGI